MCNLEEFVSINMSLVNLRFLFLIVLIVISVTCYNLSWNDEINAVFVVLTVLGCFIAQTNKLKKGKYRADWTLEKQKSVLTCISAASYILALTPIICLLHECYIKLITNFADIFIKLAPTVAFFVTSYEASSSRADLESCKEKSLKFLVAASAVAITLFTVVIVLNSIAFHMSA